MVMGDFQTHHLMKTPVQPKRISCQFPGYPLSNDQEIVRETPREAEKAFYGQEFSLGINSFCLSFSDKIEDGNDDNNI